MPSGQDIVNYLLQFKGTPYVWGGSQPGGFDCSGLMQYGFKHFGWAGVTGSGLAMLALLLAAGVRELRGGR